MSSPPSRHPVVRRLQALLSAAIVLAVVGACSSSNKPHANAIPATSSTSSGTTLTSPSTVTSTSIASATTTTAISALPAPGSIPFIRFAGNSPPDGVSPAGSGCTPPSMTTLPDGQWFGLLKTVDSHAGTIGLDLACIYGGTAANNAAKAAGLPVPVPNDHYISNKSANVYTLRAIPDVAVGILGANNSAVQYYPTKTGIGAATPLVRSQDWMWVQRNAGWVVAIQQQYIP
jgi:hypothetical protein